MSLANSLLIGAFVLAVLVGLAIRIISEVRLNRRLERERKEAIDKVIIESREQRNESMDKLDKKFDKLDEAISEWVEEEDSIGASL